MGKKEQEAPKKVLLGRPSNNVKIGLVGLPNVGKSSLFNLFGGLQVAAENFPFCTIDPSDTKVNVPDQRFKDLCNKFKPKKEIPAVLTVTDIAGLVKGAAEGKGLGNAFLSHIQSVDAIYHVTRAFVKKEIEHVEGTVDPVRDFEIIRNELRKKDVAWMTNHVDQFKKKCRSKSTKEERDEIVLMDRLLAHLVEGKDARNFVWTNKEIVLLNQYPLLTAKPVVYLVNISKMNMEKSQNKWFAEIQEWVKKNSPGDPVIPFSAAFEEHLVSLSAAEKEAYLKEHKLRSMMPKIIRSGYSALQLINFFTVGADEVRAWSIREGTRCPQAAGTIHGDFEKHFVCGEVYNYTGIKEHGDEKEVKAKGLITTKGKDYVMLDGDIMTVKHNAGGASKKK